MGSLIDGWVAERTAWWETLPCVFAPVSEMGGGGAMGFFTADVADEGAVRDAAVVAFEARRDAEAAAWAWAAAHDSPDGPQR